LERAGVVVRMPASWSKNRPAHPQVKVTVGGKPPSQVGMAALLDFRMEVTLDGETLSKARSGDCWPNRKG
jgi:SNF2 Helicase protein